MSATHDTHNWDLDSMENDALERNRRACRERGEELERQAELMANAQAHREWLARMKD